MKARVLLSRLSAFIAIIGRPEHEITLAPFFSMLAVMVISGAAYGAVMGSYDLIESERVWLMIYGAVKVPLLIAATTITCLPAFFVLNSVLGLRSDFSAALRAVQCAQAAMTLALASLAPFTRFVYICGVEHRHAVLFNAAIFTIATALAQVVLFRRYRPLIARAPSHRAMLWTWFVMYAFVGIQSGWMLRPFIGTPGKAVTFLRDEPLSNAYIVVAQLITGL